MYCPNYGYFLNVFTCYSFFISPITFISNYENVNIYLLITFLRVTVEGGMKLANLSRVLESVSLGLDLFGRIPDLAVCDAIAVGK